MRSCQPGHVFFPEAMLESQNHEDLNSSGGNRDTVLRLLAHVAVVDGMCASNCIGIDFSHL